MPKRIAEQYANREPEEGDYVISSNGYKETLSIVSEGFVRDVADIGTERDLVHFIWYKMEKDNYFPSVWYCSDHGNLSLVRLYKHCYRFY